MNLSLEPLATGEQPLPRINAMSVDVEEYFQVSAFEAHINSDDWSTIPSRVEASMDRILELFDQAGIKATFFTLGCVARAHPEMLRRMADGGHEIACHGMNHVRVTNLDRPTFQQDVIESRDLLEQISGAAVIGYRAPSYSIGADNLWALEVLAESGFRYSSSIYPGQHPAYGMPGAPRFACRVKPTDMLEIPVTTVEIAGKRFPCAGGGFFRLYPYAATRAALRRVNRHDGQAALFYFHPWELDPAQPRVPNVGLKTRVRHYLNLGRVEARLQKLLRDFEWGRMDEIFLGERGGMDAESDNPDSLSAHHGGAAGYA